MPTWLIAMLALVSINAWTFFRFGDDKNRAMTGQRRIPEANLLGLALIGGSPGALLGRHVFRHKTRKQPFSTQLFVIVVVQIGAAIGYAIS